MKRKHIKEGVSRYLMLSIKILIIVSFIVGVVIPIIQLVAHPDIKDIFLISAADLIFKMVTSSTAILIPLLTIDISSLERSKDGESDYTLIEMLYKNNIKANYEIISSIVFIQSLITIPIIYEWSRHMFSEANQLSNSFYKILAIPVLITGAYKAWAMCSREIKKNF